MQPVILNKAFQRRSSSEAHLEAGSKSIAWYHDGDENKCEGEDENGEENENGDQKVDRQSRQSMGHVVPATEP